jgi:perosamine synthetase
MHQQPVLRQLGLFEGESYPVAERLCQRGFYVPSGLALTDEQIFHVSETLKQVFIQGNI